MRITLEPTAEPRMFGGSAYPKVSVEVPYDDIVVDEFLALLKQAMVAFGFGKRCVEEADEGDHGQDQD